MTDGASLYRHFDTDGRLLYVGVSLNPVSRLGQHERRSNWFHRISRVEVEYFERRDLAHEAERQAILCELPEFNQNIPKSHLEIPLDPGTTRALARLHELAKAPTGHGSPKQRKLPGPAPKYPKAAGEKLDLIKELWAGVLTNDEVAEAYGKVMRCPPPSRSWLVTELGLGKRPKHPDRRRKPRKDKGTTKDEP